MRRVSFWVALYFYIFNAAVSLGKFEPFWQALERNEECSTLDYSSEGIWGMIAEFNPNRKLKDINFTLMKNPPREMGALIPIFFYLRKVLI